MSAWDRYTYIQPYNTQVPYADFTQQFHNSLGRVPTDFSSELAGLQNYEVKPVGKTRKTGKGFASALGKAANIAGGALSLYEGYNSLSNVSAEGQGNYDSAKSQIKNLNQTRIPTYSMDAIAAASDNFTPLKTNYGWKDMYALGGYMPNKYSGGGRMATGILGNTVNGLAAGASTGNLFATIGGAALGLGTGIAGAIKGKHKAKDMANEVNTQGAIANDGMYYKLNSALDGAKEQRQLSWELGSPYTPYTSSAANGGWLDMSDGIGVTDYDLASDYLTIKDKQAQAKNSTVSYLGNMPSVFAYGGPLFGCGGNLFNFGGDLQTNGADYSTGLVHIDAGGSHEENPYGGVQMGIAADGTPNQVEQHEAIDKAEDYVFSDRIPLDKKALKRLHLYSKGGKLTYADASKKLEKESEERPNDPISKASFKRMLLMLQEEQERQKAEQEAKEARKVFEALSPEEQAAVMQQIAAQQNGGENGVENSGEEVPVDENGNPIEEYPTEMFAQGQEVPENTGIVGANGGHLHMYPNGGWLQVLSDWLNLHNSNAWSSWAKTNNLKDFQYDNFDWDKAAENTAFIDAVKKSNPIAAHLMENGYTPNYTPNTLGYNLNDYETNVLIPYKKSLEEGNIEGNYAPDENFLSTYAQGYNSLGDYEKSSDYDNYTKALVNVANAAQNYRFNVSNGRLVNTDGSDFTDDNLALLNTLYHTAKGTRTKDAGNPVPLFVKNSDGTISIATDAEEQLIGNGKEGDPRQFGYRNDGKGGIFHLNPKKLNRGKIVKNWAVDTNGNVIGEYTGDTSKLSAFRTQTWDTADNNNTYNYYKVNADGSPISGNASSDNEPKKLDYLDRPYKYAPVLGSLASLGLWGLGVGKPPVSGFQAAVDYSKQFTPNIDYRSLGNYRRYNPQDILQPLTYYYSNSRGTDRAITNNNLSAGAKAALQLQNAATTTQGAAKVSEGVANTNEAQLADVYKHNTGIDEFNANAFNRAKLTDAEIESQNRRYTAQLMASTAAQNLDARNRWYNALYGNLSNLTNSYANMDKETRQENMFRGLINNGVVGAVPSEAEHWLSGNGNTKKKQAAKGGKLSKKKKGLTF